MERINFENVPTFFSGANTGAGFVSFYDSLFPEDRLNGLYIIKGGSGTGKSTFMRRLGSAARDKGYCIEHYLCGSDAGSLDGIIIRGDKGTVGVIDGTPPHPREFRSPGAAGDILNFGAFWDSHGLRSRRREIDLIAKEKAACFDTAYRYLGAADKIDRHISSLASGFYLRKKANDAASRLVSSIGVGGTVQYKQLSGFTMNGPVSLSPADPDIRKYNLCGNAEISKLFLLEIERILREKNISAVISRSPMNLRQIDGIYFPESKVWLSIDDESDGETEKLVNMRRFIDKESASASRQRLRFGKKCRQSLMEGAFESLSLARIYHFSLEEIYKQYMDFDTLNTQSEIWYSEILSRLD